MNDTSLTPVIRIDAPDDFVVRDLIPLTDFSPPAMPRDELLRRWWKDAKRLIMGEDDAPYMDSGELEKTTLGLLDDVVAPPACGPVLEEIGASIDYWVTRDTTPVKIVVTPPCDDNCVMESWAKENDLPTLAPPSRLTNPSPSPTNTPDLSGDGVLVIPRLADWFMRHRNGLKPVRLLLEAIAQTDRRIVVGCNAWAWAFLVKAVEADMVLPTPEIFCPFDEDRLYHWLHGLARADATRDVRFRLTKSGRNVFPDDEDPDYDRDFFKTLAGRSLGIPWVAWYLWRASLRSRREVDDSDANGTNSADDAEAQDRAARRMTLWISEPSAVSLPSQHPQTALLVLHAILLHHSLTVEELRETVPIVGGSNIVATLIARGFVRRLDGTLTCHPAAYGEIRAALSNAGFPMSAI
ncbi:MAG: hypothetical protein WA957_05025 [Alteraurantiacibacter sp.]